jgi:hypothetical protein
MEEAWTEVATGGVHVMRFAEVVKKTRHSWTGRVVVVSLYH